MEIHEALQFIRSNPRGVLSTTRRDGRPQLTPVVAAVDGDGRVVISTRETAFKVANLRRDPWATYAALSEAFFGQWAHVEGPAEVVSLPSAMELLVDYYRRAHGEHQDWTEYRAAMEHESVESLCASPSSALDRRCAAESAAHGGAASRLAAWATAVSNASAAGRRAARSPGWQNRRMNSAPAVWLTRPNFGGTRSSGCNRRDSRVLLDQCRVSTCQCQFGSSTDRREAGWPRRPSLRCRSSGAA